MVLKLIVFLGQRYKSGELLTGEVKSILIDFLSDLIAKHQVRLQFASF